MLTYTADAEAVGAGARGYAAPVGAFAVGEAGPRRDRGAVGVALVSLDICEDEQHCRGEEKECGNVGELSNKLLGNRDVKILLVRREYSLTDDEKT